MTVCATELLRKAFLDRIYNLSHVERGELALGLTCLRVSLLDGRSEIVSGDLYLADEYRYEYFGRWDIEDQSSEPKSYQELTSLCEEKNMTVYLSAKVLNAIDDHVDQLYPGAYHRSRAND